MIYFKELITRYSNQMQLLFQYHSAIIFIAIHTILHSYLDYNKYPYQNGKKTGQDSSSVIADPLFLGDVSQCDFFTIKSNSPKAQLGLVNITKLSR